MTENSIANSESTRQGDFKRGFSPTLVDWAAVCVYNRPNGATIEYAKPRIVPSTSGHNKRGEITGFSVQARQRLRQALIGLEIPQADIIGFTFSVPWRVSDFEPLMDEFRVCWHRFITHFRKALPKSGMIYRVELQKRRAPHIHAVVSLAQDDSAGLPAAAGGSCVARFVACSNIAQWWRDAVYDLHGGSYTSFCSHGVKWQIIDNHFGAISRYLSDHTSKRKQAQLGYKGKQWGIVGRGNYVRIVPAEFGFQSAGHYARFMRALRKVMRYRLTPTRRGKPWKRVPPFGSVLIGCKRKRFGEFFGSGSEFERLWEFTKSEE